MSNEYLEQLSQCYVNYCSFIREQLGVNLLIIDTNNKTQQEVFDEVDSQVGHFFKETRNRLY